MDSKKLAAIMVTAVVAIACTRAGPPFESIWCPSTKVFDETTGECVTRCCSDCVLSDPRTPCDEDRCVSDPGYCMTGCGSENSAACTCDPPCLVDFVCNPIPSPPVCEAACVTERCTPDTAYCNQATGGCEEDSGKRYQHDIARVSGMIADHGDQRDYRRQHRLGCALYSL